MSEALNNLGKFFLFHTSFQIIKKPDIKHGRANADFAQGFYLSDNEDFSKRWARNRKGITSYINRYILNTEGLKIKSFSRDLEWYDYICSNRAGKKDYLEQYDLVIGPIANDTLYDTLGILTSGMLKKEEALQVLQIGAQYNQLVIKSQKAAEKLTFEEAYTLSCEEIEKYQALRKKEEEYFQSQFTKIVGKLKLD